MTNFTIGFLSATCLFACLTGIFITLIERKMIRVEEIKRPLKKGEVFLVPCIVNRYEQDGHFSMYITPVFNSPHSDRENGQYEVHYHVDYRFVKFYKSTTNQFDFPRPKNKHSKHIFVESNRPVINSGK
ncbi:MAG: hypothetical protein ACKO96_18650, partial [Flammeovirgaceae bacterium]